MAMLINYLLANNFRIIISSDGRSLFMDKTELLGTGHQDILVNHGYLAVDFFFLLSGFVIGYTVLPVPLSMDIRGWQEMHPLNSVGWSLFFEYFANILYAIGIRKFSKTVLGIFVLIAAIALAHMSITSPNGDVSGGWTLNTDSLLVGITRTMYPFFAGLLLSRIANPPVLNTLFCGVAS